MVTKIFLKKIEKKNSRLGSYMMPLGRGCNLTRRTIIFKKKKKFRDSHVFVIAARRGVLPSPSHPTPSSAGPRDQVRGKRPHGLTSRLGSRGTAARAFSSCSRRYALPVAKVMVT
jgi:hypothetical protein